MTKDSDDDKGWLLAWLVFGVLAAYEVGALAMRLDGGWGAVLSPVFLLGSVGSLSVLALRAIRHAQPRNLSAPLAVLLLALLACLWLLYGSGVPAQWVTAVVFGAAYSIVCLLVSCAAMVAAWRRRRAHQARLAELHVQRDRHQRLEGLAESAALLTAVAASADESESLGADSDYFALPTRPKWEES